MSHASPLSAQQRRFNYVKQPGRILGPSMILTDRQYRRLCKKSRGTHVRIWIDEHKRLQAVQYDRQPGLRDRAV